MVAPMVVRYETIHHLLDGCGGWVVERGYESVPDGLAHNDTCSRLPIAHAGSL